MAGLGALVERAGLRGLGFALGVAVNALPTVAEKASQSYHAIRLRGGFQRRRLEALRLWLVAVVVATLRHADDVVSAAEARAFSADRPRRLPALASWPDVAVTVLLVGAAVVILVRDVIGSNLSPCKGRRMAKMQIRPDPNQLRINGRR